MLDNTRLHSNVGEAIADALTREPETRTIVYEDAETGQFGWATWREIVHDKENWYYTINPMFWVWDSELGEIADPEKVERMAKEKAQSHA